MRERRRGFTRVDTIIKEGERESERGRGTLRGSGGDLACSVALCEMMLGALFTHPPRVR